jgi:hypothetical protein
MERTSTRVEQLKEYYWFNVTLAGTMSKSYQTTAVACVLCLVGGYVAFLALYPIQLYQQTVKVVFGLIPVFTLGFFALPFIVVSIHRLTPSGRLSPSQSRIHSNAGSLLDGNIYDGFFHTLATRQATNPRDMSFGLHSILERCQQQDALKFTINYNASVGDVYEV